MAVRTTADDVKAVLGSDYDGKSDLRIRIRTASIMVDRCVTRAAGTGAAFPQAEQRELETWLAAHYYCVSDKPYQSKSTMGASASFVGQTGKGLEATLYGQTAKQLDPSRYLAALDTGAVQGDGAWLGMDEVERDGFALRGYEGLS